MPSPDLNDLPEATFRNEVRSFIEQHCPPAIRYQAKRLRRSETETWMQALATQGWMAPGWPREHGGMGLDVAHQLMFQDELDQAGVGRFPDQGIAMLGPILIRYGTPAQQAQHLPAIVQAQTIWCQGYSEPGSGSDLASLRTKAVLHGDVYVVNGQKIWTTLAHDADWIFMLVRTDPEAKAQRGITFMVADMRTPGITVRPIRTLSGEEEFCEVFFDDVRVPVGNVIGEVNKGWDVAKALLGFERLMVGSPRQAAGTLARLEQLARQTGFARAQQWQEELTQLRMDLAGLLELHRSFAQQLQQTGKLGPEVSISKIVSTELNQRVAEKLLELAQAQAAVQGPLDGASSIDLLALYWQSRPATIYGGANEIQRNILAKVVLDLPQS